MQLRKKHVSFVNKYCMKFKLACKQLHNPTYAVLETEPRVRGTQREYSSKPLKHSTVKRILVFKRQI